MELFPKPKYFAPKYEVKINDTDMLPLGSVLSIFVDESIQQPDKFDITLNEYFNLETKSFKWLKSDKESNCLILPGNKIEIALGFAEQKLEPFFMGHISAISLDFKSSGAPVLKIEGYDISHKMKNTETEIKNKKNAKYSDVAKEIAGQFDLKTDGVNNQDPKQEKIDREKNKNDYDFLQTIAEKIGYLFYVRENGLNFKEPEDQKEPAAVFEFGKNILNFDPRFSTARIYDTIEIPINENQKEKKIKEFKLKELDQKTYEFLKTFFEGTKVKSTPKKLENKPVKTEEDAVIVAREEFGKMAKEIIKGTLECISEDLIRPDTSVEVKGLGGFFDGKYYVEQSKHNYDESGYKSSLTVRRIFN